MVLGLWQAGGWVSGLWWVAGSFVGCDGWLVHGWVHSCGWVRVWAVVCSWVAVGVRFVGGSQWWLGSWFHVCWSGGGLGSWWSGSGLVFARSSGGCLDLIGCEIRKFFSFCYETNTWKWFLCIFKNATKHGKMKKNLVKYFTSKQTEPQPLAHPTLRRKYLNLLVA